MSSRRVRGARGRGKKEPGVEETALYKKGDWLLIPIGGSQGTGAKTWAIGPVVNIWGRPDKPVYQVLLGHPKTHKMLETWEQAVDEQQVILAISLS